MLTPEAGSKHRAITTRQPSSARQLPRERLGSNMPFHPLPSNRRVLPSAVS